MIRRLVRSHPDALAIVLVTLIALGTRLSFEFRVAPFISKDSQSYFLPAWDLLHAGDFQLGLRRTPGYPAFLALALVLLGEDLRGITLLQHLLGAGTAALTYLLGRLTFGRLAGLVAGVLVALSAPLLVYEHYILTEALFGFFVTATMVTLVAASRRPSARLWLLGGLLLGLAALIRPVAQVLLPLALLAALLAGRRLEDESAARQTRAGLRSAALVAAGFALLVVPWTVRNALAYNLATPSTFGRTLIARTAYYDRGFVFYDPGRTPTSADPRRAQAQQIIQQGADRRESDGVIAQRLRQELSLDPVEVNALMRALATEAILQQPLYFLEGSLRFGLRIFNGIEIRLREHENERRDVVWEERIRHLLPTARGSEDDFRAASRMLGWYQPARLTPVPLVLFALGLAAALVVPTWRPALLPGATAVALILASAALDGPQERYRYPVDPAITVLMAGGAVSLGLLVGRLGAGFRRARGGSRRLLASGQARGEALSPGVTTTR